MCRNAFELIFAFDEARRATPVTSRAARFASHPRAHLQVISLGHKENVTLAQVRTFTEMESHEEKLHKMIIASKIADTKDLMKRKATEIDKSKMERKVERGFGGGGGGASASGFGGGGVSSSAFFDEGAPGGGAGGGAVRVPPSMDDGFGAPRPAAQVSGGPGARAAPSKGLVLGKGGGKTNAFIESLRAEGEAVESEPAPRAAATSAAAPSRSPAAAPGSAESVVILVEEKVSCVLKKDGGLESLEVQGTMQLEIAHEEDAFCRVAVSALPASSKGVQFKTHPNIDKALHANSGVLALKDASRPFPTGSQVGILKWRCVPKEDAAVPLQINCWPSLSGASSFVSIEYEATPAFDLHAVKVTVPLPPSRDPPSVSACDGDYKFDARKSTLTWSIELVDADNRSGTLEFSVPAADAAAFFPIDVSFSSRVSYCGVAVEGVTKSSDGSAVKFTTRAALVTDSYTVQ